MTKVGLIVSYRKQNKYGGFTWSRNNPLYVRSRLDMNLIRKANESDHKLLCSEIITTDIKYGPGIIRVNSTLLNSNEVRERVNNELKKIIERETSKMTPQHLYLGKTPTLLGLPLGKSNSFLFLSFAFLVHFLTFFLTSHKHNNGRTQNFTLHPSLSNLTFKCLNHFYKNI